MESRSYDKRARPRGLEKSTIETDKANQYNSDRSVALRLIYPSKVKLEGPVTGKPYVWDGSGSVVEVDSLDAETLLQKRIGGRSCCGAIQPDGNQLFEKA